MKKYRKPECILVNSENNATELIALLGAYMAGRAVKKAMDVRLHHSIDKKLCEIEC